MHNATRVAKHVKTRSVRLIFDSAEMGCEVPRPFGEGLTEAEARILANRFGVVRRRRFEPSEADRAWWAAESARMEEEREMELRAAEWAALDRLERGYCC